MNTSLIRFAMASALAMTLSAASTADASPTSGYAEWSHGGLYVQSYRVNHGGDLVLRLERGGALFTNWVNSAGTNTCSGNPTPRLHRDHPSYEEVSKTLLAAALAKRPLHVWFEGVSGICWIKYVEVSF